MCPLSKGTPQTPHPALHIQPKLLSCGLMWAFPTTQVWLLINVFRFMFESGIGFLIFYIPILKHTLLDQRIWESWRAHMHMFYFKMTVQSHTQYFLCFSDKVEMMLHGFLSFYCVFVILLSFHVLFVCLEHLWPSTWLSAVVYNSHFLRSEIWRVAYRIHVYFHIFWYLCLMNHANLKWFQCDNCMSTGHINEYPTMHYFGVPRHTQSTIAYKILTEYFWEFQLIIALWECF